MHSDVPVQSASSVFGFACTTGSWHATVPQATLHCPRRPSAAPRAGTWTAVVARLHTAPCDPHGGHASRPTADTPLFAPILHMVRADRILRYFAPAWTSRCASRVIAAPMCLTQYWLAPAALIILLPGIGHHTADSLYCRITLSSTKQVEAADHSSYVGSIPATRIVDISVRSTCWSCRQLSLLTSKSLSWRSPLITSPPPPPPHLPASTGGTDSQLPDSVVTLYRCFISRQLATVPRLCWMTVNIIIMTVCCPRLFTIIVISLIV